jgi:hypothetical protein
MAIPIDHPTDSNQKKVVRAKLELFKGGVFISIIWAFSLIPPFIGGFFYYNNIFLLFQQKIAHFYINLKDWRVVGILALTGVVVWGLYFLRIITAVFLTRICLAYCNWRSPRREMVGAAGIGKQEAKSVNIYHLRNIILRVMGWLVNKSAFPWLANWAFNFVKANKIGKGTVIEDQFYCKEYLETGKDVYIAQGSQVSSHMVDGKYGAITLKKVKIGEHTVLGALNLLAPGVEIGPYAEFLPTSASPKFQKLKGFTKYYGLPIFRISRKRYMRILEFPDEYEQRLLETKQKKHN